MCCDDQGEFLITGDTQGYVKVWDISEYCTEDKPAGLHYHFITWHYRCMLL